MVLMLSRGETVKVKAALQPHPLARRSGQRERACVCLKVMAGAGKMVQFVSGGAGKAVEEAGIG